MKTKFYFLIAVGLFSANAFSQTKVLRPLTAKTVAPAPTATKVIHPAVTKPQNKPAPKPTDLQNAVVNILTGDDGKDNDTWVYVYLLDNNKRIAAVYTNSVGNSYVIRPNDEFYAGASVSLPMTLQASVPTGEMKQAGGIPIPLMRQADLADFNNQGEVKIQIVPNGHDTWKMQTLSITFSFNNDGSSPHKITWSNIVVSQNNTTAELLFDKNFNPIQ